MDDKTLAEKCVALGDPFGYWFAEWRAEDYDYPHFVRDPRVAIALMGRCVDSGWFAESCQNVRSGNYIATVEDINDVDGGLFIERGHAESDSLPRAIVEACCLALEES